MPASPAWYPPNPLNDRFTLGQLPKLAPWVAERIDALGRDRVLQVLTHHGLDPAEPQTMFTWVEAMRVVSTPVQDALAA